MSKSKTKSGDTSGGVRVDATVRRRRALELRQLGMTFKAIGNHPEIGGVSTERARQLVMRAERELARAFEVKTDPEAERLKYLEAFLKTHPDIMVTSIEELELSVRANNCLRNTGISTIGELIKWSPKALIDSKNFGKKSLSEIKEELARIGMNLAT